MLGSISIICRGRTAADERAPSHIKASNGKTGTNIAAAILVIRDKPQSGAE